MELKQSNLIHLSLLNLSLKHFIIFQKYDLSSTYDYMRQIFFAKNIENLQVQLVGIKCFNEWFNKLRCIRFDCFSFVYYVHNVCIEYIYVFVFMYVYLYAHVALGALNFIRAINILYIDTLLHEEIWSKRPWGYSPSM
jgi:hypothetical protein